MPLYEHKCEPCRKVHLFHRPMSQAGNEEVCPDCSTKTTRIYSFTRKKEFFGYFDEQYKTYISSETQERREMKKHGHVYTRETPAYDKFKTQRRLARKKPFYVIPGVKASKMDRD